MFLPAALASTNGGSVRPRTHFTLDVATADAFEVRGDFEITNESSAHPSQVGRHDGRCVEAREDVRFSNKSSATVSPRETVLIPPSNLDQAA
jgi:hypothetical protein